MVTYIDVRFPRCARDPSLEAAAHRWVARLQALWLEVQRAAITIEPCGRRRTTVQLTVALTSGASQSASVTHEDAYFAVSEAFRDVKQQFLVPAPRARSRAESKQGLRLAPRRMHVLRVHPLHE